ncbi:MAG: hypothetical protein KDA89_04180, partial [Planctomycetaceae bacterium]|nr:hypothetical protein [Planctomycetaceae bacterium]
PVTPPPVSPPEPSPNSSDRVAAPSAVQNPVPPAPKPVVESAGDTTPSANVVRADTSQSLRIPPTPSEPNALVPTPTNGSATAVTDNASQGRFSPTFGTRFVVRTFESDVYGPFPGALITSEPQPGSPLHQLKLTTGDIITRLDDARVRSAMELEIHARDTSVRFLSKSTGKVQVGVIYIDEYRFFDESGPTAPGTPCRHAADVRIP